MKKWSRLLFAVVKAAMLGASSALFVNICTLNPSVPLEHVTYISHPYGHMETLHSFK